MKTYKLSIGNLRKRKGHRRDCAQALVVLTIRAETPKRALELARLAVSKPRTYSGPSVSLRVACDPDSLRLSDLTEVPI